MAIKITYTKDELVNRKSATCFVIGALILFTSGCVDETSDGSTMTFTYEMWVPLTVLAGGLFAVAVGWQIRESFERYGWALIIAGPIIAIVLAPSYFLTRAVVSDTSFSRRGVAWATDIKYDDLRLISISSKKTNSRHARRRTVVVFSCMRKDGTKEEISVNSEITEAAAPYFLERAAKYGVPILNQL